MKKNIAVNLVFLLSLVVLGALMSWPGDLLDRFVQNDREENYVFTLTLQLNELQRSLKSESTEQRISIASGSRENLREYSAAVKRSNENLARLWALTDGRPQYRARLSEMLPLIEQRRVLLQGGLDKRIQDPRGRELIREIRRRISDLKDQLLKDLRDSSAGQQQSLRGIRTLMVAKSVLVALLFTTVFVLLRREIARRAREEEVLTRHRDHLDDLVACRTAELVKANELLKNEMEIRKKAEFALHNLNRHTAFIREEERRTISRDIHDEIGQALTALKLDLAWIERKFLPDNAEFLDRTASMKSFLDRLIGKVQNIISELRPPLLDSLGVVDAIHWQTHEFRRRNGIACELSIQENINDLDMHVATTVIRIIMEALTNVSRHAQATKVRIEVKFSGNRLLLEISDNGRGLTPEEIASPTSYGLLGMRERAALCDGTLSFATPPRRRHHRLRLHPGRTAAGGILTRILVIDDHVIVRKGLIQLLSILLEGEVEFVEASTGQEGLDLVHSQEYALVLLDLSLPGRNGLDVLGQIRQFKPKLPVLVLSMYPDDQYAVRALRAGASGYVTKASAAEELQGAIEKTLRGERYVTPQQATLLADAISENYQSGALHNLLSDREYQFICMLASGKTMTQIADELSLSVKTISSYRARVLDKLRLKTNAELINYCITNGLLP